MKNVRLIPACIALILVSACNRNPPVEQKTKTPVEARSSALEEVKKEIIEQNRSNSYAAVSKLKTNEYSEVKPVQRNRNFNAKQFIKQAAPELTIIKEEVNNSANVYDIFKEFDKPFQTLTFSNLKDTIFTGTEGTTLKLNANSFVAESSNKPIKGPVEIKLKEYYSIADMLLANLSTKSGPEMLETGGMVYLEAYSGKEKLKLKTGSLIEIGFPYQAKKEGMQLFNGKWNNNSIDWIPAVSSDSSILLFADVSPDFPGGQVEMFKYLSTNINYPTKAIRQGIRGTVILNFIVQIDGSISGGEILRSVSSELDAEAIRVVNQMPRWIPGRKNGQVVACRFTIPIRFSLDDGFNTNDKEFAEYFENLSKDSVSNSNLTTMSRYLLATSKLGWINCDRFIDSKPKITYRISSENNTEQDIKIVFHRIKSILSATYYEKVYSLENIPLNEKITIIALKRINNKPYLAIRETKTSKFLESELAYEEVTLERLKMEMQKLNRIN